MQELLRLFILPITIATILSYLATPLVIKLAWKLNIIDDPKKNKHEKVLHTKPTPRGGGLASFIAILITSLILIPLDKHLLAILLGSAILVILGLIDDKKNLNPYIRLLFQFIAASLPIAAGIGIAFITNPVSGNIIDLSNPKFSFFLLGEQRTLWVLSDLFALFWIVTIMNFLNMGAKGVDGQLTGVIVIAALTIALLSLKFTTDITEWQVTILASILAGSFLGFLPWHVYPQKIMPSFSGSNLGGYLLAILAILTTTKVGTLSLVLAIPLLDTGYTIVRRILQGKSPVWGDRGHLHHRLLDAGLTKRQVAFFYWGITLLLGILSLILTTKTKVYAIVSIFFLLGGLILWLSYRPKH